MEATPVPAGNDSFQIRIKEILVIRGDKPQFDESTIVVSIEDEAAGEFVSVAMADGKPPAFDVDQWPVVKQAIGFMVSHCRKDEDIGAHED
jgi:hypothetical protein